MSELFKPVVLQRPLITPSAYKIGQLQSDLIGVAGQYIPLDFETVRFVRPDAAAISIVGGNIIEHAMRTATDRTELPYLAPQAIADRIMEAVVQLPNHNRVVTAKTFMNCGIGGRPDRRTFGTQLEHSDVMRERFIGTAAVRLLGGIPINRNQIESHHSVAWAFFRTEVPGELEARMAEAANDHFPPGSEMAFGPVSMLDLNTTDTPYMFVSSPH
jgi:hypothetical protein